MQKLILVDVDDTLLDWFTPFQMFVHDLGYETHDFDPVQWDLEHWFKDLKGKTVMDLVREFNASDRFKYLKAFSDASLAVDALARQGYTFIPISSCTAGSAEEQTKTHRMREENLYGVFTKKPFGFGIKCLPLGGSKKEILSQFEPAYWVEDNYDNALTGAAHGHHSFLLTRPHNEGKASPVLANFQRVGNWYDIYRHIVTSKN